VNECGSRESLVVYDAILDRFIMALPALFLPPDVELSSFTSSWIESKAIGLSREVLKCRTLQAD
jgi:hypothetical protein